MTQLLVAIATLAAVVQAASYQHVPSDRLWVAQCSGWPVTVAQVQAQGDRVLALRSGPQAARGWIVRTTNGRRYAARVVMRLLGTRAGGQGVYAVSGPAQLTDYFAPGRCSWTGTWSDVMALPLELRQWVADRATVCGTATRGGRTFSSWPGAWIATPPEGFSVGTVTGLGPPVVAGGSPCAHVDVDGEP